MRAFVSINIENSELIKKIKDVAHEVRNEEYGINITKDENLHFTLKFLGEINENEKEEIIDNLSKISLKSFSIRLRGLGVFPDLNYIRIIWIGAESQELMQLAEEVDKNTIGIKSDEKFVPHLTIARVKSVRDKAGLRDRIIRFSKIDLGSYAVDKFYLMESKLLPEGPIYEPLKVFNLA
ncbi:MAG: RNA 2',3'-cyclic phosphodiesterase [Nitrososphaeria archaeon]|jgi:2'-5' RNA ligase